MRQHNIQAKKQGRITDNAMTTWPDEALVMWITSKKPHWRYAFSLLAARHRPKIIRACLFRLSNHHDAEDATQDVILRVYNNLHQFQGRAQFKTWLNTIVVNYCNTFGSRRSRYTTGGHIEQLIELHEEEATTHPHDTHAEQSLVNQVMSALPDNTRQVLSLRFYSGYSLEEISRILRLNLSATKARLYRAIAQFKRAYIKLENADPLYC